jgi:hypothetical protein
MTREELFSAFPRPWRSGCLGVILCADRSEALTVDTMHARDYDEDVEALAELIVDLGNDVPE